MPQLTFEAFQASRTECTDLGAAISDARWDDDPAPGKGYLYLGSLYIEEVREWWPDRARSEGRWYLMLENTERISDDLESLERDLYQFALSAGYEAPKPA